MTYVPIATWQRVEAPSAQFLSGAPSGVRIYSLYGLKIRSALALPTDAVHDCDHEFDVDLVESGEADLAACEPRLTGHYETDGFWESIEYPDRSARIRWKNHFEFFVSGDGSRVLWRRLVSVSDEVLLTYLLNQVLSHCLVVRGVEPLHATCVVIKGRAIAILGNSGDGKSTLAAEFVRRGFPLLTDDVLVLSSNDNGVLAFPSLARLKLVPEAADAVFERRRALPMNSFTNKMIIPLESSEHFSRPVPLAAFYVLPPAQGRPEIRIEHSTGHRAFVPLIEHIFHPILLTHGRLEQQLRQAAMLVQKIPVRLLSYPRRLESLPAVVDAILADVSSGAS